MDIEEQFNLVAKSYDENRKKFISCFDDYYISSTDFIARTLNENMLQKLSMILALELVYFLLFGTSTFQNQSMCW